MGQAAGGGSGQGWGGGAGNEGELGWGCAGAQVSERSLSDSEHRLRPPPTCPRRGWVYLEAGLGDRPWRPQRRWAEASRDPWWLIWGKAAILPLFSQSDSLSLKANLEVTWPGPLTSRP